MTTMPWYSDDEIDDMCDGHRQNAAKIKYLENLGLTVMRKPNGKPLLMRAHAEIVLSGLTKVQAGQGDAPKAHAKPDRAGLLLLFKNKAA